MLPGLLGTWPWDLVVAAVLAHASCSPHLPGSPTSGGDAGGNLQVMRQKLPARGLVGAGMAATGRSGHIANPKVR